MRGTRWSYSSGLVLVVPIALIIARAVRGKELPVNPAPVEAVELQHEPRLKAPGGEPLVGVLLPQESAEIVAPVAGRVVTVPVRIGDRVRAGEILATLDSRLTQSELASAEAAARSQRAEHRIAQAAREAAIDRERRVRALAAEGLASGADLATASREREQAALRVTAAQALVAQREAQAKRISGERQLMDLRAPFDGVVVARYVNPGATVADSPARPIVRLISADRLFLRFAIPGSRAGSLSAGLPVRATSDIGETVATGRIVRIAPEVDPASHILIAEASVDAQSGRIVAGAVMQVVVAGQ
jgi:RND family efflux transporter MFP subunit